MSHGAWPLSYLYVCSFGACMAEQMLQCLDNGSTLWSGFAFLKFLNSFPVTLKIWYDIYLPCFGCHEKWNASVYVLQFAETNHLLRKRKQVQGTSRYFVLTIGIYISVCMCTSLALPAMNFEW